jgi:hypothetical protein
MWEETLAFLKEIGWGDGGESVNCSRTKVVDCRGYGVLLTPWNCLENQLSLFCLPGFPCHDCEVGVGLGPAGVELRRHRLKTCATDRKPKTQDILKGMSRAVARDLGLL